jgi:hypothetical protein
MMSVSYKALPRDRDTFGRVQAEAVLCTIL